MAAAFAWPPYGSARASCLGVFGAGLVIPCWDREVVYGTTDGATVSALTVAFAPAAEPPTGYGFVGVAESTDTTSWLLSASGQLVQGPMAGAALPSWPGASDVTYALPGTEAWIGLAMLGPQPYACAASGRVFTVSGPNAVEVSPPFGADVCRVSGGGSRLYAVSADPANLLTLSLAATASGALSSLATPFPTPCCVASLPDASAVAVAGWGPASFGAASGFAFGTPGVLLPDGAASNVTLLTGSDPAWASASVLGGLAGAAYAAWSANGQQALVSGSSDLYVLNLSSGALALDATLALAGAGRIALTPTGDEALVCQPSQNQVSVIGQSVNVWSAASTVAVAGAAGVIVPSGTRAVVGGSGGLSYLSRVGSTWSVASTLALGFAVTALVQDASGRVYAVGDGNLAVLPDANAGSAVSASASWSGKGTDAVAAAGRVMVLDAPAGIVRFFDPFANSLGLQVVAAGTSAIGFSAEAIWLPGTGGTPIMRLGAPAELVPFRTGSVCVTTNGTSWTTYALGIGAVPTAVAWDGTSLHVATEGNSVLTFAGAASGALPAPTTAAVPVCPGQDAGVGLGLSALAPFGGHLYAATCESGALVQVL